MIPAAPALALMPVSDQAARQVQTTGRTCDRSVEIPVVCVNDADQSLAVLQIADSQTLLHADPAGSGGHYDWPSDGSSRVRVT